MVAIVVLQVSQRPLVHFSESSPSLRLCAMDGLNRRRKAAVADRDCESRKWAGKRALPGET
jgi:hypothetical protein